MSQHDLNIANQGFPAFRADLNDALVALGSTNSGATAPATTFANQLWYDTANNILKIRNEDNDAWISIATLDQSGDLVSAITATTVNGTTVNAGALNATGNVVLGDASTDTLNVGNGALVKDASGNIGIGVTPSAWSVFSSILQGNSYTLNGYNAGGNVQSSWWMNAYRNSSGNSVYYSNGAASQILQGNGLVYINSVGSGTTGNTITWSQVFEVSKDQSLALQGATGKSGTGITFPATQSASSDANTLDDYEEGTWSPTILGNSTAGTTTYTTQNGTYTKIGRMVTVTLKVQYTAATGTGTLSVGNFPFTAAAGEHVGSVMVDNLDMPANGSYALYLNAGQTTAQIYISVDNGSVNAAQLSNEAAVIWTTITYFT
jgi:hypothetical protein